MSNSTSGVTRGEMSERGAPGGARFFRVDGLLIHSFQQQIADFCVGGSPFGDTSNSVFMISKTPYYFIQIKRTKCQ